MGLFDFLFGAMIAMDVMDTRKRGRSHDTDADDDEEDRFDDGDSDDYVGDGLDGEDDYLGDGLDGPDDDDDCDDDWKQLSN